MPGPGYGYKSRKDPAPREIAGGSSRIHLPEAEETRRTDIVSKTNFGVPPVVMSNVDDFYCFPRPQGGTFVGKDTELVGGAVLRWNADIKRYSKNQTQSSSTSANRFQVGFSPKALVDPLYPPSGIVVKVQDLVRASFAGIDNAQHAKAVFTVGPQAGSSVSTFEKGCIGWAAQYGGAGQPTWFTRYSSKDGAITRQVDSGLQCDTLRQLSIVFDGKNQQIRWYANGVLVDTYSPSSGEVGGQTTLTGRDSIQFICSSSNGNPGFGAQFDYLMLGVPLMTVQYPEA